MDEDNLTLQTSEKLKKAWAFSDLLQCWKVISSPLEYEAPLKGQERCCFEVIVEGEEGEFASKIQCATAGSFCLLFSESHG